MTAASLPDLMMRRTFHAPRSLVWKAFTDPAALRQWWGPHHFTNSRVEVDLRVGGALRIDMTAPDGTVFPMTGTFTEIREPELLAFTDEAFMPDSPEPAFTSATTVTFKEDAGRTIVTVESRVTVLRHTPQSASALAGMEEGWSQQMERLGHHVGSLILAVPEDTPVVLTSRIFDAPRELVWKALTEAEHLRHWWGPRAMETILCEIDARPGGSWRIHQRVAAAGGSIGGTPEGTVIRFKGRILEVVPPEKLVQTFGVEDMYDGKEIVETVTLTDLGNGQTLYKAVSVADTFEERAGVIDSGMSYGAQEMFDRLDEYLPKM